MTTFISYSHDSEAHKQWVRHLGEDLNRIRGDVVLDQWDLVPGDHIPAFMAEAVREARRVVLVCTERYAARADEGVGGAGYEAGRVFGRILKEGNAAIRAVPIVRSGAPADALPSFLEDRLYVDFRDDAAYHSCLQQLVAALEGKTTYQRPGIPSAPSEEVIGARPGAAVALHATRRPAKWLLVAGTGIEEHFTERARTTAQALGQAIALSGYGLITGGWPGVDETTARCFARALRETGVPLENRLTQVIADGTIPPFAAGNLVVVAPGDDEWIESVRRADGIVLIGGLGGTGTTGRYAIKCGKAVFPIADTGGDARHLYLDMLKNWNRKLVPGLSKMQFQIIAREAPEVINDLMPLLDHWTPR